MQVVDMSVKPILNKRPFPLIVREKKAVKKRSGLRSGLKRAGLEENATSWNVLEGSGTVWMLPGPPCKQTHTDIEEKATDRLDWEADLVRRSVFK